MDYETYETSGVRLLGIHPVEHNAMAIKVIMKDGTSHAEVRTMFSKAGPLENVNDSDPEEEREHVVLQYRDPVDALRALFMFGPMVRQSSPGPSDIVAEEEEPVSPENSQEKEEEARAQKEEEPEKDGESEAQPEGAPRTLRVVNKDGTWEIRDLDKCEPENFRRIHFLLPVRQSYEEAELYFMQFGKIEYMQFVDLKHAPRTDHRILEMGFICYFDGRNAKMAKEEGDQKYKIRWAPPRTLKANQGPREVHLTCGRLIAPRDWDNHVEICAKQRANKLLHHRFCGKLVYGHQWDRHLEFCNTRTYDYVRSNPFNLESLEAFVRVPTKNLIDFEPEQDVWEDLRDLSMGMPAPEDMHSAELVKRGLLKPAKTKSCRKESMEPEEDLEPYLEEIRLHKTRTEEKEEVKAEVAEGKETAEEKEPEGIPRDPFSDLYQLALLKFAIPSQEDLKTKPEEAKTAANPGIDAEIEPPKRETDQPPLSSQVISIAQISGPTLHLAKEIRMGPIITTLRRPWCQPRPGPTKEEEEKEE